MKKWQEKYKNNNQGNNNNTHIPNAQQDEQVFRAASKMRARKTAGKCRDRKKERQKESKRERGGCSGHNTT